MLDQTAAHNSGENASVKRRYDLAVIGAGIAGLNALHAAVSYLPAGARVLLLDRKPRAGGMWNTAYDYVRLHQPHPMFTVGNLRWDWTRLATYLARRDEVQGHLAGALDPIVRTRNLNIRFGHEVTACEEVPKDTGRDTGLQARITFHPTAAPDRSESVLADRAIFASGFDYRAPAALKLTSDAVISIAPQDLRTTLAAHPDVPVYVVGGGKTGMDTILETWSQDPSRRVTLIKGPGTNFLNRTKYVPTGVRRWTSGAAFSALLRDIALVFDGDNEAQVIEHFRRNHSTDPGSANGAFLFGFQSEEEQSRIAGGLAETLADYLTDVTDTPDGPQMALRHGSARAVEPGSIFVNCTGSFFRAGEIGPAEPCLSPHGTLLRINHRDALHFHTSVSGFFTTHLFCRGELRGRGLYAIDHEALFRADKRAWVGATAAQAYLFHLTMVETLPMPVLNSCFLDLDRWYPLPRRLVWFYRLKRTAKRDAAHCRTVLDRTAERFGISCKPLE